MPKIKRRRWTVPWRIYSSPDGNFVKHWLFYWSNETNIISAFEEFLWSGKSTHTYMYTPWRSWMRVQKNSGSFSHWELWVQIPDTLLTRSMTLSKILHWFEHWLFIFKMEMIVCIMSRLLGELNTRVPNIYIISIWIKACCRRPRLRMMSETFMMVYLLSSLAPFLPYYPSLIYNMIEQVTIMNTIPGLGQLIVD